MLQDWIWLTTRKALGPRGVLRVLEYFGTPERAAWTMRIHATCDRCPAARHCDIERVKAREGWRA